MKTVLAAGSFIVLHPGHIYFLTEAKKKGDYLTVVIAHDTTIKKRLGKTIVSQEDRKAVIEALKPVDEVRIGNPEDIFAILNDIRPDVIALGYDQDVDIQALKEKIKEYKLSTAISRISQLKGYSGTAIREKIKK